MPTSILLRAADEVIGIAMLFAAMRIVANGTKGDATDRPPGRRPLAPPEIASGNGRNTSRQIFHPAEIAIGPAFLEHGLLHGGSPRRVDGYTQNATTRRVTSPVARPIVPSHAPGEHKCPQAQCA